MSEIKPALTAEEWASIASALAPTIEDVLVAGYDGTPITIKTTNQVVSEMALRGDAHQAAAVCLYGQPFGFTWEDVLRHRDKAEALEASIYLHRLSPIPGGDGVETIESERDWHTSMAKRIEALLPPEE